MNDVMTEDKRTSRKWLIRLAIAGASGIAILLILAIIAFWPPSEEEMARRALDLARLADLPPSASSIEAGGTSNMFSMTYLLRFEAPADEIETFIQNSPGLTGLTPDVFTPEHMCLPYEANARGDVQHHRFFPKDPYPWFDPTIRKQGRFYEVPQRSSGLRWQGLY